MSGVLFGAPKPIQFVIAWRHPPLSRVPDARSYAAAPSRDPGSHTSPLHGPRLCSASLRAALRPGHESGVGRATVSASSLRAQRSNPESLRGKTLDCFAALAM